jgi:hypothetical protein
LGFLSTQSFFAKSRTQLVPVGENRWRASANIKTNGRFGLDEPASVLCPNRLLFERTQPSGRDKWRCKPIGRNFQPIGGPLQRVTLGELVKRYRDTVSVNKRFRSSAGTNRWRMKQVLPDVQPDMPTITAFSASLKNEANGLPSDMPVACTLNE